MSRNRSVIWAVLWLSSLLAGQGGKARVAREIAEIRAAMREGKAVLTHVRVEVRLRNGNKIAGVVKNGRLVEKVSGLRFVGAERRSAGAGLRIWYHDNTVSFVFLPFEAIRSYRIGTRLTDVQVEEIEARMKKTRRVSTRREEALRGEKTGVRVGARELPPQPVRRVGETGKKVTTTVSSERLERETKLIALADAYPPEAGWGQDRLAQIQRRKVTLGVFPAPEERRFVESFADWQEGVRLKKLRDQARLRGLRPTGDRAKGSIPERPAVVVRRR